MNRINDILDNLNYSLLWKVFAITLVAGFLMAVLPKVRLILPAQVQPVTLVSFEVGQASAYIAVDFDSGKVLAEKNSPQRLPIASLTKIMTAVVALDLAKPQDLFTVSAKATRVIPTSIGVVRGQRMSLEELIHALLLTSANDAAQVIQEGIDRNYGEGTFVRAMNEKAVGLGLQDSHFDNPQGFDSRENFSSAEDLALLTRYAINRYQQIAAIVQKDYQFLPANENHKQFDLYNWNGLLGVYPGVRGVKIGNTGAAGVTTVVLSEREGKRVLVVLLGAPGILERDLWAAQLLDLGFESLGITPANISQSQLQTKYQSWKYW